MKRLFLLALVAIPLYLFARDFSYEAKVLEVTPVRTMTLTDAKPEKCFEPPGAAFEALLSWDLGCDQPHEVETTYWHVTYQLGQSTYTIISDEAPGETIALRIRLNPLAQR